MKSESNRDGTHMEPLIFQPILKRARWGGRRLGSELGKPIGNHPDYAESWEIADHGADQSIVAAGPHAPSTLSELLARHGTDVLGRESAARQFPLLIKFLDANDWLSLQVHPNDQQAKAHDPRENGKTEAWVILDAAEGSRICCGLKPNVTRRIFEEHLTAGTIESVLHTCAVRAGDCVFVPAGTVHAIGPGVLLAEVQQQSDLTFRLHDWGRLGADGQPRELHVAESLACIDFERGPVDPVEPRLLSAQGPRHEELVKSDYFIIERYSSESAWSVTRTDHCRILMNLAADVTISTANQTLKLPRGQTVLLPAASPDLDVTPQGSAVLLNIYVG